MKQELTTTEFDVAEFLDSATASPLKSIAAELRDTFAKRQMFRTDTEARVSVLNDGSFPTRASKYWQSVREQAAMLSELALLSFEMRKILLKKKRLTVRISSCFDVLDQEELQIELDETIFRQKSAEVVGQDRCREILMWSKIKSELDNGSFDTTNVNTHQADSMRHQLEHRRQTLTPQSSQGEVLNVLGPLHSIEHLGRTNGLRSFDGTKTVKTIT